MKRGYTKAYRKELDGDIWKMPPLYHRVFYYLRQKAKWKPELFPSRKYLGIWVIPGQVITSIDLIAKGVSWTEYGIEKSPNKKTIKVILDWLENNSMIQVVSNGFGTMINIINWDTYQAKDDEEVTVSGQGNGQQFTQGADKGADTIKEGIKNEKNEKNEKNAAWIDSLKISAAYSHINLTIELSKMDMWLSANPGRQKSKKFILNWLNKIPAPIAPEKKKLQVCL